MQYCFNVIKNVKFMNLISLGALYPGSPDFRRFPDLDMSGRINTRYNGPWKLTAGLGISLEPALS